MRILAALLVISIVPLACGTRAPVGAGPSATATPVPSASRDPSPSASASPSADVEATVRARATAAVTALRDKDFAALAALAHPVKGVRFSPYAFVDVTRNVVLDAAAIRQGFASTRTYMWGFTDGRGDAIDTNFEGYYKRYIYNKDYAKAPTIVIDQRTGKGNSLDNSATAYPGARVVEYYLPSTDPNTTLDWAALRLVFEEQAGTWYLVGIIHDEWTI